MAMTPDPGKSGVPDMEHDPQLAAMYRAGSGEEPPARLDDAIRAAARREVVAGPRRRGLRRWSAPVALAAVVVLSVTVVTMMREQGADLPESMILPPPAATPAASAGQEIVEPPASVSRQQKTLPERVPAKPEAVAPTQKLSEQSEDREQRTEQRMEPGVAAFDGSSGAGSTAAEMARTEEDSGDRRDQAPSRLMRRSVPAPTGDAVPSGPAVSRPAAPAAALSAPDRRALWKDLVEEPPEKWIRRMVELRAAGRMADADAVLAEFRRRFPDQPLPENAR